MSFGRSSKLLAIFVVVGGKRGGQRDNCQTLGMVKCFWVSRRPGSLFKWRCFECRHRRTSRNLSLSVPPSLHRPLQALMLCQRILPET